MAGTPFSSPLRWTTSDWEDFEEGETKPLSVRALEADAGTLLFLAHRKICPTTTVHQDRRQQR